MPLSHAVLLVTCFTRVVHDMLLSGSGAHRPREGPSRRSEQDVESGIVVIGKPHPALGEALLQPVDARNPD